MIDRARPHPPRISAVVPVRNGAEFLPRAVHSITSQSVDVEQVIVVDDRSTDDTWLVATMLAAEDARVIPLRNQRRHGAQGARNTGICAARGDWIALLDSDDYLLPDSLKTKMTAASENGVDVVYSNFLLKRRGRPAELCRLRELRGDVLRDLLRAPGPVFGGLLVTRRALGEIGLLDESIVAYQEWDTSILLARRFEFAFVEDPTMVWDRAGTDTISGDLTRNAAGYAQIVTKHRDLVASLLAERALAHHYVILAEKFSMAGNPHGVLWTMRRLAECESGWRDMPAAALSIFHPWRARLAWHARHGRVARQLALVRVWRNAD